MVCKSSVRPRRKTFSWKTIPHQGGGGGGGNLSPEGMGNCCVALGGGWVAAGIRWCHPQPMDTHSPEETEPKTPGWCSHLRAEIAGGEAHNHPEHLKFLDVVGSSDATHLSSKSSLLSVIMFVCPTVKKKWTKTSKPREHAAPRRPSWIARCTKTCGRIFALCTNQVSTVQKFMPPLLPQSPGGPHSDLRTCDQTWQHPVWAPSSTQNSHLSWRNSTFI